MRTKLQAVNKQRSAKAQQTRAEVLARVDKPVPEIADELKITTRTVYRHLQKIQEEYRAQNLTEYKVRVEKQEAELEAMLDYLLQSEELTDSELGKLFREYKADIAKLRGLNAESRSVVAHVSPSHDVNYLKFKSACADLTDTQLQQVFDFAAALVREPKVTVRDASWFPAPEPKQLGDGQ